MKQVVKEELSAGGVVYRITGKLGESESQKSRESEKIQFLIGKHSGYHKWVLPKGLVESGEGPIEAAIREVEEEVGVKARVVELVPIKVIEYWYQAEPDESGETTRRVKKYQEQGGSGVKAHKRVIFYLMEMEQDLGKAGWEMSERKWVSYEEGMEMLAFESEREVMKIANKLL